MKPRLDMSPAAVSERLRLAAEGSDLHPARRLDSKLDMSAEGVSRRLREVAELNQLCARLQLRGDVGQT